MSRSTVSTASTADPSAADPRDLRRFWRILFAVILPLGPLGITVGRAIMPYWTDQDSATIVANSLAHPEVTVLLGWIGLVFYPALLLGMLLLGYLARRRAPVLATLGAGLSFLAYANWSAAGNSDLLIYVMGRNGYDAQTILQINEAIQAEPIAVVTGVFWLLAHIVGMILLGLALGRSGIVQWWVAIALIASQPIHFISAVILPSRWLDVVLGWGLTTVCFAIISIAMVRMLDDDWDLPPEPVRTNQGVTLR